MRKRMKWIGVYLVLAVLLFPADRVWAAGTEGICSVGITVGYGQTEARSMLQMINDFRTGPEAWEYDRSGNKVYHTGLGELEYDYGLEKAAMQRAAEIAVYFDHTRPNGEICFTLGMDGENIAAGQTTAAGVFKSWQETDEPYAGQGHRRNMLGSNYTAIGIGHVYFNRTHYWVQEFGVGRSAEGATEPNDLSTSVGIEVLESNIVEQSAVDVGEHRIVYGQMEGLPVLSPKMRLTQTLPQRLFPIEGDHTWAVEDETFAAIEGEQIIGKKVGTTALLVNGMDNERLPLIIEPCPIQEAEIQLSVSSCDYDGREQTPKVQAVTLNGRGLDEDDYTVSYEDNIGPGTAKVVITGKGNYQGTAEKEFAIICRHQFDDGQIVCEATCTEAGEKLYTCMICGETKTEPIEAAGHTEAADQAVPPTCTGEGKTEGSHCSVCGEILVAQEPIPAVGHVYGDTPFFDWDGTAACRCITTCTVCGDEQAQDCYIVADIVPATCTENGKGTYTATSTLHGDVYTETKTVVIEKTGHTYERIITKATLNKDGRIIESCSRCAHVKSQTVICRPGGVKLSSQGYIYDGKEKRPSVTVTDRTGKRIGSQSYKVSYAKGCKNVGTYRVTVNFRGEYTGQMSQTFTIRPKGTSLTKVQSVKGRKMKVKWKRNAAVSGYQIQYAAKTSFKGAGEIQVKNNKKLEQTISKLAKGKRYYVRIRTYKTVSGGKIYSDWSGKKSIIIRK